MMTATRAEPLLRKTEPQSNRRPPGRQGRARRLSLAIAVVSLLALGGTVAAIASVDVPSPVEGAWTLTVPGDTVAISMVGDTLLGGAAQPDLDRSGGTWAAGRLHPFLSDDIVIANLEGPITEISEPADPTQKWTYNASPEAAQALSDLGVDAVSLANNHAMDRGPQGMADTIAHSQAANVATFGAGATSNEARLPLLIESSAGTVAVAGFGDSSGSVTADTDRAGLRRTSAKNFEADYALAKEAGADRVVAYVHWGENYAQVDERQRVLAQALVDAGYDLVVGHGPHVPQPLEFIDGVPVFYSLGNWVFGTPGRFTADAPGYGLVLRAVIEPIQGGDIGFELRCIGTDNHQVNFRPLPCSPVAAERVLKSVHPDIVVTDGTGRLQS